MKTAILFLLLLVSGQYNSIDNIESSDHIENTEDIVIRHDKPDSLYLALGAKFPSVCKVGERGGDGTLVGPKWVITAAHVAEGMFRRKGSELRIYFENSDQGYPVESIYLPPDFRPMESADIALIKLKEEVKGIQPAKLYNKSEEEGKEIILVGHGDFKTGKGGEWKVDGKKRGATNTIDKVTESKVIFDFDAPPGGTSLEGTAGRGDSGGPAFLLEKETPFVVGISSAGFPGENGPGTYGAIEHYTRVSSYTDWIKETMSGNGITKALSTQGSSMNPENRRGGNPDARPGGGPLEGLGLFLMQEGDRIRIGGKADPMVPEAFRQVMFKPPSYLVSFNNEPCTSLKAFTTAFNKLDKGESFSIGFEIQGEEMHFTGNKM